MTMKMNHHHHQLLLVLLLEPLMIHFGRSKRQLHYSPTQRLIQYRVYKFDPIHFLSTRQARSTHEDESPLRLLTPTLSLFHLHLNLMTLILPRRLETLLRIEQRVQGQSQQVMTQSVRVDVHHCRLCLGCRNEWSYQLLQMLVGALPCERQDSAQVLCALLQLLLHLRDPRLPSKTRGAQRLDQILRPFLTSHLLLTIDREEQIEDKGSHLHHLMRTKTSLLR